MSKKRNGTFKLFLFKKMGTMIVLYLILNFTIDIHL